MGGGKGSRVVDGECGRDLEYGSGSFVDQYEPAVRSQLGFGVSALVRSEEVPDPGVQIFPGSGRHGLDERNQGRSGERGEQQLGGGPADSAVLGEAELVVFRRLREVMTRHGAIVPLFAVLNLALFLTTMEGADTYASGENMSLSTDRMLRITAATGLAMEASRENNVGLLHYCVEDVRSLVEPLPQDDPHRAWAIDRLASVLTIRHWHTGRARDLTEAVRLSREALVGTPHDDRLELARRRTALGNRLITSCAASGALAELEEAVDLLRQAVALWPEGNDDWTVSRDALIQALSELCRVHPQPRDALDLSITALQEAADAHRGDTVVLAWLADRLFRRYDTHRVHGDLLAAVDAVRHGLAGRAGGTEWHGQLLYRGASALKAHHAVGRSREERVPGRAPLLDEAVRLLDQAVPLCAEGGETYDVCRWLRGAVWAELYRVTGDGAWRDMATTEAAYVASREAVPGFRADSAARLGELLMARHRSTGDSDALREAAQAWALALSLPGALTEDRPWIQLAEREAREQLEGETPGPHPRDPARTIAWRSRRQKRSVDSCLATVLATPQGSPDLVLALIDLRGILWERLDSDGEPDPRLLDEAVRVSRWVVRLLEPGDPEYGQHAIRAAHVLRYSGVWHGRLTELDESLELRQEATQGSAAQGGERRRENELLAEALADHHALTGRLSSLDDAIEAARTTLAAGPEPADRALAAEALSDLRVRRHNQTGDSSDLEESADLMVVASKVDHGPAQVRRLRRLASQLRKLHAINGDSANSALAALAIWQAHRLDPSLDLSEEEFWGLDFLRDRPRAGASSSDPPGFGTGPHEGPDTVNRLCALVEKLTTHITSDPGNLTILNEAVSATERLLKLIRYDDTIHFTTHIGGLGALLYKRYELTGRNEDRIQAHRLMRQSVDNPATTTALRVSGARMLGTWASMEGRWPQAAENFRDAVRMLPLLLPHHVPRADQERQLSKMYGLAAEAAVAALECGDPAGALEVLELGRGVLHGYAMEFRSDLSALAAAAPELAEELREVTEQLEDARWTHGSGTNPSVDARHRLARRRDELLDRVRKLPGFSDFLSLPRAADLLSSSVDAGLVNGSAVVVLNTTPLRSDALVIRNGGLSALPLPGLDHDELTQHVSQFADTIPFANINPGDMLSQVMAQEPLREVLAWLWHAVAEPVLDHLGLAAASDAGRPLPRLWWVPSGSLTLLPLHAAGLTGVPGASVMDRAVSSYSVTVRALRHAQNTPRPAWSDTGATGLRFLAASGGPEGAGGLPRAASEVANAAAYFTDPLVLQGPRATYTAVTEALAGREWVHFACHGMADPYRPSSSRLILQDGHLTVTDVARRTVQGAELAYVSACETARGGLSLADEGITMASAFQLAGFRHAVGSLWNVLDRAAAQTADLFYQHLDFPGGTDPAVALHRAQLAMRDRTPMLPTRWAPYIHAGP